MTLKNMKQKKLHEIELWTGINSKFHYVVLYFGNVYGEYQSNMRSTIILKPCRD